MSEPSELCRRLDNLLGFQNARDASKSALLEKAQVCWNSLATEEQKLFKFDFGTCCDPDMSTLLETGAQNDHVPSDLSEVSSHSNLLKFLLWGRLNTCLPKLASEKGSAHHDIDIDGNGKSHSNVHRDDMAYVIFSVLPFPKLFERLKIKDFLSGQELGQSYPNAGVSTACTSLTALLHRLDVPEKHWDVTVSDFELAGSREGSYHNAEFWNPVATSGGHFKDVRPPRKLEMRPRKAKR